MSKRVRFTADYDYEARPNSSYIAYKAGMVMSVPDPHAEAAIAAKKAVLEPDAAAPVPQPATAKPAA